MCGITEHAGEKRLSELQSPLEQAVQNQRAEPGAQRDENKRVGELPVKLKIENRVGVRSNQDIQIGQQAGDPTRDREAPYPARISG